MRRLLTWYFDIISPYVYLQLADLGRMPDDIAIEPKPVLLAGLLNQWGQKGPAEIPGKRLHTYRQCAWMADERNIPFRMPPTHPFNPLGALRLLCALGPTLEQARIASAFVFGVGQDPSTAEGLNGLARTLGVADPMNAIDQAAKDRLRTNTEHAAAQGVWGVPTFAIDGELFWGADSLPMMLAFLANPAVLDSDETRRYASLPAGASRKI